MSAAKEQQKPAGFRVVVLKESDVRNKVQYAWKPIRLTSSTGMRSVSEDIGFTNTEANNKLVTMIKKIKTELPDPAIEDSKPSTSKHETMNSVPGFVVKTDPTEVGPHLEFETTALDSIDDQDNNLEILEKENGNHETLENDDMDDNNSESMEKVDADEDGCDEFDPSADMDQSFLEPEAADVYANIGYSYPQSNCSSSSGEEEDSRLAQQLIDLETQFQEKEAQNQLVRKTKLEALEAGIKFIGALFNFTGLGSLRVPVNRSATKKTVSPAPIVKIEPETVKSASADKSVTVTVQEEKSDPSGSSTVKANQSNVLDENVAAEKDEDCDLGVFNPAELTRKMKQFISGEDSTVVSAKKIQKNKRLAFKTKLYKHHRRRVDKISKIKDHIKIPAVKIKVEPEELGDECANNNAKISSLVNGELTRNTPKKSILDNGVTNNGDIAGASPAKHSKPTSVNKEIAATKRPSIQELRHRLLLEEITAPRTPRRIVRPRGRGRGRPPLVSRRYDPILKPSFIPSGVENNQEHRTGIVKSVNGRRESRIKRIEMNTKTINLETISQDTETDEERNRRLLELANATGSMSIKHQMTRNSCIDDLFQSSLFQSPDL